MAVTTKRIKFTLDEYMKMSDADIFGSRRMELLFGRIYRMPAAQAHPHRWSVSKGFWALRRRLPAERYWVVSQGTLLLNMYGAPEPDLHAFDVPEGTPQEMLPKPFVVIEISDKTYRRDSGVKLRQFASVGIADYWIVNLNERRVEVYRKPANPTGKRSGWTYDEVRHYKPGQKIKLNAFPKISIGVSELLP